MSKNSLHVHQFTFRSALEEKNGAKRGATFLRFEPVSKGCCWHSSKQLFGSSQRHRNVLFKTEQRHTLRSFFVPTRKSWTAVGSFSFRASSSHCLQTEKQWDHIQIKKKNWIKRNKLLITHLTWLKEATSVTSNVIITTGERENIRSIRKNRAPLFVCFYSVFSVSQYPTLRSSVIRRGDALEPLLSCSVPSVTERPMSDFKSDGLHLLTLRHRMYNKGMWDLQL